jgi:hypothetical protein
MVVLPRVRIRSPERRTRPCEYASSEAEKSGLAEAQTSPISSFTVYPYCELLQPLSMMLFVFYLPTMMMPASLILN